VEAQPIARPYAPPTAPFDPPPPAHVELFARTALTALPVNVAGSLLVGAVSAFQFGFGLQRFGGIEYVPGVVGLAAVRSYGAAAACNLTCLTAVVVVHRATRGGPVAVAARRSFLAGLTIALLFPVDAACMILGAMGVVCVSYALPAGVFVASVRDTLLARDALFGAAQAVGWALVATLLLPRALRLVVASRRGLVRKLLVAWLVLQAAFFVVDESIGLSMRLAS
jgi:phospholipid/cholesterol/gamma-HCH transport system permease protein